MVTGDIACANIVRNPNYIKNTDIKIWKHRSIIFENYDYDCVLRRFLFYNVRC